MDRMWKPYRKNGQEVAEPDHPALLAGFRSSGFTLVEMVVVLVIVGVMATMMTPLFAPGRWRADNAVMELALTLNAAQRLAVLRQHDVSITFQLSERRIRTLQDADNDGTADAGENMNVMDLPETIGFGTGSGVPDLPQGAGPISFGKDGKDPVLTFHRNGSASSSGVVYVHPTEGSLADLKEGTRALTIERATGEIRCFSYRTGSWADTC